MDKSPPILFTYSPSSRDGRMGGRDSSFDIYRNPGCLGADVVSLRSTSSSVAELELKLEL